MIKLKYLKLRKKYLLAKEARLENQVRKYDKHIEYFGETPAVEWAKGETLVDLYKTWEKIKKIDTKIVNIVLTSHKPNDTIKLA